MSLWPIFLVVLVAAAEAQTPKVREAVFAGTWYPGDAATLEKQIRGYLAAAPKVELGGPVVALISPHAGYAYSGRCAGSVFAQLRGRDIRRVIVLAPSHHVRFSGGSLPDVDFFETPLGRVPLDREACTAILKSPLVRTIPQAHAREHAIEIELPFLQTVLKNFKLVPIVLGELEDADYAKLAGVLREHLDAHTVVVVSSDFTHYGQDYGYVPFRADIPKNLEKLDKGAVEQIVKLDSAGFRKYVADTGATICGRVGIGVLLDMLTPDCRGTLVNYYRSGDEEKDYTRSVSYAGVAFSVGPGEVSKAGQKTLLDIARKTLQATLASKAPPKFDVKDEGLLVKRGVFVTYKNKGQLRGCIGRFEADEALWKTVQQMAVASARQDFRFADNPILAKEEPNIEIDISVLSPMVRVKDPLNFIVGVHGLYIRQGRMAGTYLPQVATEQGWDKRTFITHLCQHKIGIAPDAWKEKDTEVYIYSAQVFGDKNE